MVRIVISFVVTFVVVLIGLLRPRLRYVIIGVKVKCQKPRTLLFIGAMYSAVLCRC